MSLASVPSNKLVSASLIPSSVECGKMVMAEHFRNMNLTENEPQSADEYEAAARAAEATAALHRAQADRVRIAEYDRYQRSWWRWMVSDPPKKPSPPIEVEKYYDAVSQ